jgi:3-dehydroquinate synthase
MTPSHPRPSARFSRPSDPTERPAPGLLGRVSVSLGHRSYDIFIGEGILRAAGTFITPAVGRAITRVAIISHPRIFRLHGAPLVQSLKEAGWNPSLHLIPEGERGKTIATAERLYSGLVRAHLDRHSLICALGGGVIGDLAGFVAATFLRGIAYVQIPTTLVAAIDSAIGGKTGVNIPEGKNLVGAFHQPALVLTDVRTLRTLPRREISSGLCEAIKYGVIRDGGLFQFIDRHLLSLRAVEPEPMVHLIRRCSEIKAEVVAQDERESGLRQVLNFGHTFGHALEQVTHFRRLKHGEAVGYGMVMASRLAVALGLVASDHAEQIERLIRRCGPFPPLTDVSENDVLRAMTRDKKARGGQITFVLPHRIGEVGFYRDVPRRAVKLVVRRVLADSTWGRRR